MTHILHRGNQYFRIYKNSIFELIFYHNLRIGSYFIGEEDAKKALDYDKGKYNILYKLNSSYKHNGKYEFLLEYPEKGKTNHWFQDNNPLDEEEYFVENKKADGYYADEGEIQMSEKCWGGLVKHKSLDENLYCLIDGSTYDSGWYYAIGAYEYESDAFPGPTWDCTIVYLWIYSPKQDFCIITVKSKIDYKTRAGLFITIFESKT